MRRINLLLLSTSVYFSGLSQGIQNKNLIIITLDGFRWQEVFQGADSSLLFDTKYTKDKTAIGGLWDSSAIKRRKKLLPFFWSKIESEGQLYGNRKYGNRFNCFNPFWFSYPGYCEILVGFVDKKVNSNHFPMNPNPTVMEFINQAPSFKNKVAAFATWNPIASVLREQLSGIHVNGGHEKASGDSLSTSEVLLNNLQDTLKSPVSDRLDAFTFQYAFEYLKRTRSRVEFISLGEMDDYGHAGQYDGYLRSAHQADAMIHELWNWIQSQDEYKDQTTILITTDHGRGKLRKESWKKHGRQVSGSGQTWMAVIGPDTPALGEVKTKSVYFQNQIAKTAAALLGLDYINSKPVGKVIPSVIFPHVISRQY